MGDGFTVPVALTVVPTAVPEPGTLALALAALAALAPLPRTARSRRDR